MITMNRKSLPRPARRPVVNADAPIPFLPSCAALGLPWPDGANVPTLAELYPFTPAEVALLDALDAVLCPA